MDANKLKKLQELDYKIKKCCGNCENAMIERGSNWGVCLLHQYKHRKHDDKYDTRSNISINRYGSCGDHSWFDEFIDQTSHFEEFIDER